MAANTLEETIEERYIFLSCDEGSWRTVENTIEMNCMPKKHLKNAINMIKNYGIDHRDREYKLQIEDRMKIKIKELETELSQYKDI